MRNNRVDMTDSLAVSAPSSPNSVANKRRRLNASSPDRETSVARRLLDETQETAIQRHSVDRALRSSSLSNSPSRQPSRATSPSEQNASLVLVGTKGSGLSSFAVIAATALRFRLIDTESWLVEHYGLKRSQYVKERGLNAYRRLSSKALENILRQHAERCVLVCGPEALEPHCQTLIRAFARTHPVVMINRDLTIVRDYLGLPDTAEVLHILGRSRQLCRRISTHEFYNLPESEATEPLSVELCRNLKRPSVIHRPHQLLQNVKQDFLRFLNLLAKTTLRADSLLCSLPPPEREFSSMSVLQLDDIVSGQLNLANLDCGTDAIELVVRCCPSQRRSCDWDRISRSLQMIRRRSNAPIVYSVNCEDSTSQLTIDDYNDSVTHGLRLVPDFITIDLGRTDRQVHHLMNSVGRTKVIGHRSYSSQRSSPWKNSDLHKEFDRAVALGCHVVRFVCQAVSALEDRDCVLFQAAIASRSKVPLIAYNTGIQSRSSMVLNPCLTPVRRSEIPDSSLTSSLLTLQQLMKARSSSFIYQPLHFHIFGASIDYSLSPMMHNAAFRVLALDHTYAIKQSRHLRDFSDLVDDSFGGASISLPYKSEILPLLDSLSEAAKAIQAINTVMPLRAVQDEKNVHTDPLCRSYKNRAGPVIGLHGENTDWIALYTCVLRYLSAANTVQSTSSALVIGAGGMGRASVYALLQMGVTNIVIWNRTHSKAVQVAEYFTNWHTESRSRLTNQTNAMPRCRIEVVEQLDSPWPQQLAQPTIVICTVPAHQTGDAPPLQFEIPEQWFQSRTGGVIIELSYKSAWTPLLQQAHDHAHKGWICVEPLEILIEQGRAQFELFTGYPAPQRAMKDGIMDNYVAMHITPDGG
ncbi:hypothetical protein QM012_008172 [Aureobasidium pullulans]|uniref:Quinate repressor protein n=1 Tax=Aureobasidium pullulans TaxID=5580 RepID=A0ABR0TK98_AURPU